MRTSAATPFPLAVLLCLGSLLGAGCGAPGPDAPAPAAAAPGGREETGGLAFADIGRAAGLTTTQVGGSPGVDWIIESLGVGAAWLDYDGDGDPDLYLAQAALPDAPTAGPPDVLLRNDGDPDGDGVPAFTDVTAAAGLGDTLWSLGVAVADVEGDGDPDIYLTNWGPNRLYLNRGDGTFVDVAAAAGVADPRWGASAEWSDVDRDGDLDLYVTNYVDFAFERYPPRGERLAGGAPPCVWKGIEVYCGPRNLAPAPDALYRNDGDRDGDGVPEFTDVTAAAGLLMPEAYFGLAAHFVDADDDGDDDLYVANDSVQNTYFLNEGDGTFVESAILAGLAYNEQGNEQAGMGVASADYDADGRVDLAVSNFSHDHDTLYRNDGDTLFTDVSFPSGLGPDSFLALGWGVAWADLDQDGFEELVVARGHVYPQVDGTEVGTSFRQPNGLYRNPGDGTLAPAGADAGPGFALRHSSRAVLPVDLDGDGDLDLLFTNLNDPPDLLRNDGARGHWLQVRLAGAGANRDGIGARVSVRAGGRLQTRQVRRSSSYAASTLPIAHFGLGDATVVEELEVRWPSGKTTTLRDLAVDRLVEIPEGG